MKAKIIEEETKREFPITFQITVENKNELRELWHRLNISPGTFTKSPYYNAQHNYAFATEGEDNYRVFLVVDSAMESRKIRP
jgi:hypothetical protein